MGMMPRRTSDHDFATIARRVVEQAIGEQLDGSPLPGAEKNPKAVQRGKAGGQTGGRSRSKSLSPARRKEIAKKAAAKRWHK